MKYDVSITENTSSISGYESTLKSHHIQHFLLVPIKGLKSRSALHSPSTAPPGTSRAARHRAVAQIWWQLSRGVGTRHPNSSPSLGCVGTKKKRSSLSNKEKQSPHLKVQRSTIGSMGAQRFEWWKWWKGEKPFQICGGSHFQDSTGWALPLTLFFSQVLDTRWMAHMFQINLLLC